MKKCIGFQCRRYLSTARREFLNATRDHNLVHGQRPTGELFRHFCLLRMCAIPLFSSNAGQVRKQQDEDLLWDQLEIFTALHDVLGPRLFASAFKPFVYDLFVAGEERAEVVRCSAKLTSLGLTPLLSPMLEDEDGSADEKARKRNLDLIKDCVDVAAESDFAPKSVAIKLTAFLDPRHLVNKSFPFINCAISTQEGLARGVKAFEYEDFLNLASEGAAGVISFAERQMHDSDVGEFSLGMQYLKEIGICSPKYWSPP